MERFSRLTIILLSLDACHGFFRVGNNVPVTVPPPTPPTCMCPCLIPKPVPQPFSGNLKNISNLFGLGAFKVKPMGTTTPTPCHCVASVTWSIFPATTGQLSEISGRIHDDIWYTRSDGGIFYWENNAWKRINGGCVRISASFETKRPWCIMNGIPFRQDGTNWQTVQAPTSITQISARNYNSVIGVSPAGAVNRYDEGKGWSVVSTSISSTTTAKHCSIGKDGTIWCVDTNRAIWRRSNGEKDWTSILCQGDVVDVNDNNRVIVRNSLTQQVYAYVVGNKTSQTEWKTLTGNCVQAFTSDTLIYCIAADGTLRSTPYPVLSS